MKKLISAQTIRQAQMNGKKEIDAPSGSVIVTPEARSVAEKLGVRIRDMNKPVKSEKKNDPDQETVNLITRNVMEKFPHGTYKEDEVRKVVLEVLAKR
jgi:ethanolamine utilization protein EutQ